MLLNTGLLGSLDRTFNLLAEFISPKKVYTFSSIGDYSIPKSVKCAQSATTLNPKP